MKQMVTMLLAVLMLSSVLAGISPVELNDNDWKATDGRADYEIELDSVLEPRETFVSQGGQTRNAVDIGDNVRFRPVVVNTGDNDQSELNLVVQVYPEGDDTNMIIDHTDGVICDVCTYQSLPSGDYLGGGAYFVQDSNGDLTWTPTTAGTYTVRVAVEVLDSAHDSDLTNNEVTYNVEVVHYTDISVDLCWTDANGDCMSEAGNAQGQGPHSFALTANVGGSESWDARETTIEVSFGGVYDATMSSFDADGDGGQDAMPNDGVYTVVLGTATDVDVWHNTSNAEQTDSDPANPCTTNANPCNQSRVVAAFDSDYTFTGSIMGDTSANQGGLDGFSLVANLVSFKTYEMNMVTSVDPSPQEESTAFIMEEVSNSFDDRTGNNDDDLAGYFSVFHDIALTSLTGGDMAATGGSLNVGSQTFTAAVSHLGSDVSMDYGWTVQFTVTDENDVETVTESNECVAGENPYSHAFLGQNPGSFMEGTACITMDLAPGMYSVKAEAVFMDASLDDADSANDCTDDCKADMNSGNDILATTFEAINDNPSVYVTMGDSVEYPIVVGDEVSFVARATDTETASDSLTYSWKHMTEGGNIEMPECEGLTICIVNTDESWLGEYPVSVTVGDAHGGSASDTMNVNIWNHYTAAASLTGAEMSYALIMGDVGSEFTVTMTDADAVVGAVLGESAGSFDSVFAFSLDASHAMSPGGIGTETLTITMEGDSTTPYGLWFEGANGWSNLAATVEQADETHVTITYTHDGSSAGNLGTYTYAVFESASSGGEPPQTGISGLTATLQPDARISLSWSLSDEGGANQNTDRIHVYTCEGAGCDPLGDGNTAFPAMAVDTTDWEIIGNHGTTYNILVQVENGETDLDGNTLAGTPVQTLEVTADGAVDPAPTADDDALSVSVTDSDVSFSWAAESTDDASSWMVCWAASQMDDAMFDGVVSGYQQNGDGCAVTEDSTMSLTATTDTVCGGECTTSLFFGVAAVDDIGNVGDMLDQATKDLRDDIDNPPVVENPNNNPSDDGGASDTAMYAIIGLVVLAVIGGAFILTRGGGGEGEDKDWDY